MNLCNCCGGHPMQDHVGCCDSGFYGRECTCMLNATAKELLRQDSELERAMAQQIAKLEAECADLRAGLLVENKQLKAQWDAAVEQVAAACSTLGFESSGPTLGCWTLRDLVLEARRERDQARAERDALMAKLPKDKGDEKD